MAAFDEQWLVDYEKRLRAAATPPTAPAKRKLSRSSQHEWTSQEADAEFLAAALPIGAFWCAIDGGRADSARAGALRKRRGVKAGVPDFIIVWRGTTLWIERKAGADVSGSQVKVAAALLQNGHRWAVAESTADIERALIEHGIPLRTTCLDGET